jgi:hypothetical protein
MINTSCNIRRPQSLYATFHLAFEHVTSEDEAEKANPAFRPRPKARPSVIA